MDLRELFEAACSDSSGIEAPQRAFFEALFERIERIERTFDAHSHNMRDVHPGDQTTGPDFRLDG